MQVEIIKSIMQMRKFTRGHERVYFHCIAAPVINAYQTAITFTCIMVNQSLFPKKGSTQILGRDE